MKVTRRLGAVAVALTILAVAHPASAQFSLGGMNEAKSKGRLRLEGKEYLVKDGDIVHIRSSL